MSRTLCSCLLLVLALPAQRLNWRRVSQDLGSSPYGVIGVVYDARRARVVALIGPQVWECDGARWHRRDAAVVPDVVSNGGALAYDAGRGVTVFFGHGPTFGATWEWDGSAWRRRSPSRSPRTRRGHAMAYDAARKRVVLFGGIGHNDTWEWDGTNWTEQISAQRPTARELHRLVYDVARQRVVLFGGRAGGGALADTWEWDGRNWNRRSPVNAPAPQYGYAAAYDIGRRRVVLQGADRSGNPETWEWDGVAWMRRITAIHPTLRGSKGQFAAFDASRGQVFWIEGSEDSAAWAWDGSRWRVVVPRRAPSLRQYVVGFDSRRGVTVFHGFGLTTNRLYPPETFEWRGGRWRQRFPRNSPPFRDQSAMGFHAASGRMIVFGGLADNGALADTWAWDGNDWRQLSPAVSPAARSQAALAYDSARSRLVLFGGRDATGRLLDDTWEWDGTRWIERKPSTRPPGRIGHALTYDARRRRVVMFGAGDILGGQRSDTWEWDGTAWSEIRPTTRPPARSRNGLAYDPLRRRVVMYGGCRLAGLLLWEPLRDTWTWDGRNWTREPTTTTPPSRFSSLTCDAETGRCVQLIRAFATETWELAPSTRAAAVPIGDGCPGRHGVPELHAPDLPVVGNSAFALEVSSLRSGAPTLLLLAPRSSNLAIGDGCTLYAAPDVVSVGVASTEGLTRFAQPIPSSTVLRGVRFAAQAAGFDPGFGSFRRALAFSAGISVRID